MCGIAGFWSDRRVEEADVILRKMTDALIHRGPDAEGHWHDERHGIFLGHRRLSIVDLSESGAQPMTSACNRYVMVFNGEIYNHQELRQIVEKSQGAWNWQGSSDTESALACITVWGIQAALKMFNGMFAIALWDRESAQLTLARDRLGEKPLYYGCIGGAFIFASELKAFKCFPAFQPDIDRNSLSQFMRMTHVPPPGTIYKDIYKLPAATYVVINAPYEISNTPQEYWVAASMLNSRPDTALADKPESEWLDELDLRLERSVASRVMADVPLGAFLSGGYDSSLVVAMMQKKSDIPVKTFTIGFENETYDESGYARDVANHLNTDHHELLVTDKDALDLVPNLCQVWDEPFSDSSQIPTHLVSKLAGDNVKVCLSGDGGDELFGGYSRYQKAQEILQKIESIPKPIKLGASWMAQKVGSPAADFMARSDRLKGGALVEFLDRSSSLGGLFANGDRSSLYGHMMSHWSEPENLVLGGSSGQSVVSDANAYPHCDSYLDLMMYLDTISYLPNTILTKVDRASMAVSLEARAPFLDHDLVEFAWTMPADMQIRHGRGKWAFSQIVHRYIPEKIMDRPKMGFGIPIGNWLTTSLRDWVETLLNPERLTSEGYLNSQLVSKMWQEHLSGRRDWQYHLWDVVVFQSWLENESRDV